MRLLWLGLGATRKRVAPLFSRYVSGTWKSSLPVGGLHLFLSDGGYFDPTLLLFGCDDGFEDGDTFGAVEEVGVDGGIGGDGVDEVGDSMNEGMFVADDVPGRPPGGEVGMG